MKKIIIILAVVLTACSKEETPEPIIVSRPSLQVQTTTPPTPPVVYNFEGNWSCDAWIVDHITGATRRRSFIFSNQSTNLVDVSLNQYTNNGTFTQLFTLSTSLVDSSYFDNHSNTVPIQFKGVMTTDSTLMVYEYSNNSSGSVDTVQIKEFIR